jgi:hypothetical protein
MGLTDILTTFKSFFSRSFWFGSFLPVAIFTGIHLVIAWWVGTGLELSTIISADTGKLITVPLALFALIVLAYAATPLIPLVQGCSMGRCCPSPCMTGSVAATWWRHERRVGGSMKRPLSSTRWAS